MSFIYQLFSVQAPTFIEEGQLIALPQDPGLHLSIQSLNMITGRIRGVGGGDYADTSVIMTSEEILFIFCWKVPSLRGVPPWNSSLPCSQRELDEDNLR